MLVALGSSIQVPHKLKGAQKLLRVSVSHAEGPWVNPRNLHLSTALWKES